MSNLIKRLEEAKTDTIEILTPSRYKVTIRQQTGEDDDIISDPSGSFMGEALNKFVQGIIIKSELVDNKKPTYQDVENMKLGDKYFIIIASRIFSLGRTVHFEYEWPDGIVAEYDEDLAQFIWDYSLDFPEKGDEDYFEFRIPPHTGESNNESFFEVNGKEFKFEFMSGKGEKYLMTLPENQLNKNTELRARNLQQKIGTNWVKVGSFKNYTAREMVAIRKEVFEKDPIVEVLTKIPHPTKQGVSTLYPLLSTPDFLFPREI